MTEDNSTILVGGAIAALMGLLALFGLKGAGMSTASKSYSSSTPKFNTSCGCNK